MDGRSLPPGRLPTLAPIQSKSRVRLRTAIRHVAIAAAALALAGTLGAAVAVAKQETWKISFTVSMPEGALAIEKDYRPPDNVCIYHARLALDEPVWLPEGLGLPQLPYVLRTVAVPVKADVQGPMVNVGQPLETTGIDFVGWGQHAWPGGGRRQALGGGGDDSAYYPIPDEVPLDSSALKMEAWPQDPVELIARENVGQYDLLTFRVSPVQWFPASSLLRFYTRIDVDLVVTGSQPPPPGSYAAAMAIDDLRARVVNPDNVLGRDPASFSPEADTRYLVITDDYKWSSSISREAHVGQLAKLFARLTEWKTQKGVKASVVTISDIVDGRWGDFVTGARDLQEVIRNFLKFANREWSTYWVLLGGDATIIPTRDVAAAAINGEGFFYRTSSERPSEGSSFHYDAASGTVRIRHEGYMDETMPICAFETGKCWHRLPTGTAPSSSNPGWAFTDADYADETNPAAGEFIILRAPAADISATEFYPIRYETTIPTDLYYASLIGPDYDQPDWHDWDKNGNWIYGQCNDAALGAVDGVSMMPTLAVGRAPVASEQDVEAFVSKARCYDSYCGWLWPDFFRQLLLAADNWAKELPIERAPAQPPAELAYFSSDGSTTADLHLKGLPGTRLSELRLIAWDSDTDFWEVPFNLGADASNLGYYFCTNDRYDTASLWMFEGPGFPIVVAPLTRYVRVAGPPDRVRPAKYFFDKIGADSALTEKEEVRALLARVAPGMTATTRLYRDYLDAPDYPAPDLRPLSQSATRTALNAGQSLVSLSGHGNIGGCCGVDKDWVPNLTNQLAAGIVFADSCLTNEFNKPKPFGSMRDAVSELFLKNPHGGAAAYIGYTRWGWMSEGAGYERLFWQRLATHRALGILHNSKSAATRLLAQRWTNFAINLLGDPEMQVWTGPPPRLGVAHGPYVPARGTIRVTVTGPGGEPIAYATACLTSRAGLFLLAATDTAGVVEFPAPDVPDGYRMTVTVTQSGYAPYQGTVTILGRATVRRRF